MTCTKVTEGFYPRSFDSQTKILPLKMREELENLK